MRLLRCWLLLLLRPTVTFSKCANACSGHGTCGANDKCTCYAGFTLNDCSGRACLAKTAWIDKASAANTAHAAVECSNRGVCDYTLGECVCAVGFEGVACEKSKCPNGCSGKGVCMSLYDIGKYLGPDTTGDGYGPLYANWEKNNVYGCNCDWTYAGPDCSLRLCPKGDDPETTGQAYRTITITTANSGAAAMSGTFQVFFNGYSMTFNADGGQESGASCVAFVKQLNNVKTATCTQSTPDTTTKGCVYTIAFTDWGEDPMQNNLFHHDGDPPLSSFQCSTRLATTSSGTITCAVADVAGGGAGGDIVEYESCGARGICDFVTGICACATGYEGPSCSTQGSIIVNPCATPDLSVHASCASFTGSALHVKSTKAKATGGYPLFSFSSCVVLSCTGGLSAFLFPTDFDLILATASTDNLFAVRGDGRLRVYEGGLIVSAGGETIVAGGLVVTAGGATVTAGGE
jgi:hypothetical protein